MADGLNEWIDRHIDDLKSSADPLNASIWRVLEGVKFGFGLGYIGSTCLIAVGQLLLGNTLEAVNTATLPANDYRSDHEECVRSHACRRHWQHSSVQTALALGEDTFCNDGHRMTESSMAVELARWVVDHGILGIGPLSSAEELADEYLKDRGFADDHERVESLIRWEQSKTFTTGFITGIGGLATIPVSIPAALGASWVLQARMIGAIARIYGHDVHHDRVRTLVLLALVGDAAKDVLKDAGVQFGTRLSHRALTQLPGKLLVEVNRAVGFRLLTKAGQTGVVNVAKVVPVIGGLVSGTFDASACGVAGRVAKRVFGSTRPLIDG